MRAREFIVEYKEQQTEQFHGLNMKLKIVDDYDLTLYALDDWDNELAHVRMHILGDDELDPQDLFVDERYRGQGIAKVMYDYLTDKGFEIHRSSDQSPDGKHFWDKNRGEEGTIWEDDEFTGGIEFEVEPYEGWTGEGLIVRALDHKDEVGHVIFEPTEDDESQWYAIDVEVEDGYQRQGVATRMYNIAKKAAQAQGKIIVRSHTQTDAGRGLWQNKKVWENRK